MTTQLLTHDVLALLDAALDPLNPGHGSAVFAVCEAIIGKEHGTVFGRWIARHLIAHPTRESDMLRHDLMAWCCDRSCEDLARSMIMSASSEDREMALKVCGQLDSELAVEITRIGLRDRSTSVRIRAYIASTHNLPAFAMHLEGMTEKNPQPDWARRAALLWQCDPFPIAETFRSTPIAPFTWYRYMTWGAGDKNVLRADVEEVSQLLAREHLDESQVHRFLVNKFTIIN